MMGKEKGRRGRGDLGRRHSSRAQRTKEHHGVFGKKWAARPGMRWGWKGAQGPGHQRPWQASWRIHTWFCRAVRLCLWISQSFRGRANKQRNKPLYPTSTRGAQLLPISVSGFWVTVHTLISLETHVWSSGLLRDAPETWTCSSPNLTASAQECWDSFAPGK